MPALGLGTPVFLVVQALIATFVYYEADKYGSRAPLVVGLSVFVGGVALAIVFSTVVEVVAAELLALLVYLVGVRAAKRQSASA